MGSACVFHTLQHILKQRYPQCLMALHQSQPQMHQIQTSEGEVEYGTVKEAAAPCPARVTITSQHVELKGVGGDLVM